MEKISVSFLLIMGLLIALALPAQAQSDDGAMYVVQANDSLWKLAEKYMGDGNLYLAIIEATNQKANADASYTPISNPNILVPGQKVWIPSVDGPLPTPEATRPTATTPPTATPAPVASAASDSALGHIAFSFWNNAPERCTYEVNIVNVSRCLAGDSQCQASRRIMSLNNISEPALHPNGNRIAFRGWGQPPSPDSPYLGCAPAHPYRMLGHSSLDGTEYVSVGGFWEDSHPDWSPDGNRIIFDTRRNGDYIDRILFINADGSGETNVLIAGQYPSWAPDGYHFVYRGCDLSGNQCGLWKAAAYDPLSWNTGQNMLGPVVVAPDVAHPDWSPTRDEIVYQKLEDGNWNLWLVNADGSNNRPLLATPNLEGLPSFSPDGNWIAYLTHNGQNFAIRIVSRDGQTDQHIFTYDGGLYTIPKVVEPYNQRDWMDEQISWSK